LDAREGVFGPRSISWKVDRESALFLGAGRAALLQLAHPWVAAALDQHSSLRADPLARFHGTFRLIFSMVFGTLEQALAASRHIFITSIPSCRANCRRRLPLTLAAWLTPPMR